MRLRLRLLPALAVIGALLLAGAMASPAHAQPPPSPPPSPPAVACGVDYAVVSDWGSGFQANATVTNLGTVPIGWRVVITFGGGTTITNWWNANGLVGPPNTIIIEPPAWLPALAPGQSYTAGFIATGSSTPTSVSISCWAA